MSYKKYLLGLILVSFSLVGIAETAEEKGLRIAIESDKKDEGFQDSQSSMTMTLKNKRGDTSVRELRVKAFEVHDDGDKSLVIFDTPKDQRGTALLSFTHKVGYDDQWLYLPALKRVKKISSRNKSGPFVGSEFSFEDMSSQEVEKYTYKYLRDEVIDGKDCYVLERYPVDKNSGYTRQISWMDKEELRVWKVDFYDRKKSLLKTLTNTDYKLYLDKYWRAHSANMINHQTGKSTQLVLKDIAFQTGLEDKDFNKNSLKRAK